MTPRSRALGCRHFPDVQGSCVFNRLKRGRAPSGAFADSSSPNVVGRVCASADPRQDDARDPGTAAGEVRHQNLARVHQRDYRRGDGVGGGLAETADRADASGGARRGRATHVIENPHRQFRNSLEMRGHFRCDEAATRVLWPALRAIAQEFRPKPDSSACVDNALAHRSGAAE